MGRGVGLKMSVAGGCWFSQRVGGWRKEGTTFVGCWMEKRKACAGSRERKSKAGRAALFFSFQREGATRRGRWNGFRVFCVWLLFFEKLPPFEYFSPPSAYGWRFTYIENLYICYLKKYCNNYCRDCLL